MGLVLDSDQTLLLNSALDFARTRLPVANLRQLRDSSDPTGFDRAAWKEMADLGWTGMLIPEELGGNGFGYYGLGLVTEALDARWQRRRCSRPSCWPVRRWRSCRTTRRRAPCSARSRRATPWSRSRPRKPPRTSRPRWRRRRVARAMAMCCNGHKRFVVDGHVADTVGRRCTHQRRRRRCRRIVAVPGRCHSERSGPPSAQHDGQP